MSNLYRELSKDASYQVSIQLAKRFQRRRFYKNRPIRNKNCLWWPCLLTDQNETSILYRGSSKDASYQNSIDLAKRLEEKILQKSTNQKKELTVVAMFVNDRHEMSNLYRGHVIDASYQVSIYLAKRFQRRRFIKIGQSETRIAYGGHVCSLIGTK